jgi:hypothetical protein
VAKKAGTEVVPISADQRRLAVQNRLPFPLCSSCLCGYLRRLRAGGFFRLKNVQKFFKKIVDGSLAFWQIVTTHGITTEQQH